MPLLQIQTNAPCPSERRTEILERCSASVAKMLGKPERYIMVSLDLRPDMLFAGETTPLAYLELKSIGLPGERTAAFSATLCELMSELLGIPADRVYIEFTDAPRHLWGWNGGTF